MTLNRPPPPAEDLTQVAARRTRSRRSDAPKQNETRVRRRSTILPVAEPADSPDVLDDSGTHHAPPTTGRRVATTRPHRPTFNGLLR